MYRWLAMIPSTYYSEQLPNHVRGNAVIDELSKPMVFEAFCQGVTKFSPLRLISFSEELKVEGCQGHDVEKVRLFF